MLPFFLPIGGKATIECNMARERVLKKRRQVKRAPEAPGSIWREFLGSERQADRIRAAMAEHDRVCSQYETEWGVGRLPQIAGPDLAVKYLQQMDRLTTALADRSVERVEKACAGLARSYAILAEAAIANGEKPIQGDCFEAPMPDGSVIAICRTDAEAGAYSKKHGVRCFSAREIAAIIHADDAGRWIGKVKDLMPDASIKEISEKGQRASLNDDIPF